LEALEVRFRFRSFRFFIAGVAELADALDSKSTKHLAKKLHARYISEQARPKKTIRDRHTVNVSSTNFAGL
jgi:hypothetical protein